MFSPFSTAQDSSPGNGATHGGSVFLLHVTLSQYHSPPQAHPEGCLQVPYRAHAYSQAEELLTLMCVVCAKARQLCR